MKSLTALLLVTLFFSACRQVEKNEPVFILKGEKVTVDQFKTRYTKWIHEKGYGDSSDMRKRFLYSWVTDEIMYNRGKMEGVEYLPEISEKVEKYKKSLIIESMKKRAWQNIYSLSEERIKKYYMENKNEFVRDKLFRIYALRVKDSRTAVKLQRMLEKGEGRIDMLSTRFSDDRQLANNNGDWGLFSSDVMDPAWKEEVLNARLGDILGPFRDAEGYHTLLEVSGFAYRRPLSFKRAYHLIVQKLIQQKGEERWNKYTTNLIHHFGAMINIEKLNWE